MSVNMTYLVIKVFLRGKTAALILDFQESVLRLGCESKCSLSTNSARATE